MTFWKIKFGKKKINLFKDVCVCVYVCVCVRVCVCV